MTRHYIYKALLAAAVLPAMTGCNEDSWNEKYLDDFEKPVITNEQTIDYTLTATDYANIAKNSANVALAKADNVSSQLSLVGTQGYFNPDIAATDYIPNYLNDSSFPYFTLSNGSAINLTYKASEGLPAEIGAIADASRFTLSNENYITVWGNNKDAFVAAFTPSNPAANHLASLLKTLYPDAKKGAYAVVNFNEATTEPTFEAAAITNIDALQLNAYVTVKGVVAAICRQGYIVEDDTEAVLVYFGSSFDATPYLIGQSVTVSGKVGQYNGGLQIGSPDDEVNGAAGITYSNPEIIDGAALDALYQEYADAKTNNAPLYPRYVEVHGKATSTGNYCNFEVEGASVAVGSLYQAPTVAQERFVVGEEVTVRGYLISASGGKYVNIVATAINNEPLFADAEIAVPAPEPSPIEYSANCALYTFNGSVWEVPSNAIILTPADYKEMGQTYSNLQNDLPELFLPRFLAAKYPYALADDEIFVAYQYYANNKTTSRCAYYIFDGQAWAEGTGITEETVQFVRKEGRWTYDPNVTITLPTGRNQPLSTLYYQTCVDWVKTNIDDVTGMTYVTSYGNNEYYSGTSAYQGNVDLRPGSAKAQCPAGYEGMSNDEIVALMKHRFESQVMPAALSILHPKAKPVEGQDVIYTINFGVYTGSTAEYVIRYKVVSKGVFEFMDCTWNDPVTPDEESAE